MIHTTPDGDKNPLSTQECRWCQ